MYYRGDEYKFVVFLIIIISVQDMDLFAQQYITKKNLQ